MAKGVLGFLKDYFGYKSLKAFRDDWQKLSEQDKQWFRDEAEKLMK